MNSSTIEHVNPNMADMLQGTKEFENNIYKFEAGD